MASKQSLKHATFFISTGRCGTQWFAEKLSTHYHDLAVVRHEPFQVEYAPRFYFAEYHRKKLVNVSHAIENHLAFIRDTIQDLHYIETGWPVYGVLPLILSRFEGRVRVVHLYRHPLKVAASLATHKVYGRGEWSEAVSISPSDYGVVQSYLAGARWNSMSEFEKCLFWSTEVNHFAVCLKQNFSNIPWLSIKFEDVFSNSGKGELGKLLNFLSLPERRGFFKSAIEKTDKYSLTLDDKLKIHSFEKYPKAVEQMKQFGYQYDALIDLEVRRRYVEHNNGNRKEVSRGLHRHDVTLIWVIADLLANCLRLGISRIFGYLKRSTKPRGASIGPT
jgi:hypothetical protein